MDIVLAEGDRVMKLSWRRQKIQQVRPIPAMEAASSLAVADV